MRSLTRFGPASAIVGPFVMFRLRPGPAVRLEPGMDPGRRPDFLMREPGW